MHLSPFDDLDRGTLSNREPPARRIGVILSILFLASLGTVATVTSARAGGQEQADARIAITTALRHRALTAARRRRPASAPFLHNIDAASPSRADQG